jgi:hypothetical protein
LAAVAEAAPPEAFRFQGTMLSLQGAPPLDGTYTFLVRVYDAAQGGAIWFENQTPIAAEVLGGAYSLTLLPNLPGEFSSVFSDGPRFIEVTVLDAPATPGGPPAVPVNETLLPRQEITAVPFALNAGSGIPVGAIILWDQGPACPQGFVEATEFRTLYPVGADTAGTSATIPDTEAQVGGDTDFTTTNAGTSSLSLDGNQTCSNSTSCALARRAHTHAFVPPFRTVLFCRKQ